MVRLSVSTVLTRVSFYNSIRVFSTFISVIKKVASKTVVASGQIANQSIFFVMVENPLSGLVTFCYRGLELVAFCPHSSETHLLETVIQVFTVSFMANWAVFSFMNYYQGIVGHRDITF